jgi:ABC-type Mn2+/Zn2+ transport system ATPase subunit
MRQSIHSKTDNPLIVCEHVSCTYGIAPVLSDVYFNINRGEFVGIVGPSGSGKTTLLKAIIGSQPVAHGSITIQPQLTIGYVPQVETVDWYFPVTVEEVIVMTRAKTKLWPRITSQERTDVREVLEKLGIADVAHRHIRELSGGQQQRVFLARAMFCQPDILVLDEPTSGVDVRTRHEILHLLADLHQDGLTILLTTHDLNGLAAHLPRLVCLNKTVIADGNPREVLTPKVLEATYGAPMEVLEHGGMPLVVDHGRVAMRGEGK